MLQNLYIYTTLNTIRWQHNVKRLQLARKRLRVSCSANILNLKHQLNEIK